MTAALDHVMCQSSLVAKVSLAHGSGEVGSVEWVLWDPEEVELHITRIPSIFSWGVLYGLIERNIYLRCIDNCTSLEKYTKIGFKSYIVI